MGMEKKDKMDQGSSKARDFALQAHGDQKYGADKPYVVHLDDVAAVLERFGYTSQDVQDSAFLHDVLEDTSVKADELEQMFGSDVVSIVKFCTDEKGASRRIRKGLTYARMQADIALHHFEGGKDWIDDAIRVKLADRIANIQASLRGDKPDLWHMYAKERVAFGQALFVSGVCDPMWDEYEFLLRG